MSIEKNPSKHKNKQKNGGLSQYIGLQIWRKNKGWFSYPV